MPTTAPPPKQTIEAWAAAYLASTSLEYKLAPPTPPRAVAGAADTVTLPAVGRPPELQVVQRGERTPRASQLRAPHKRARLLHTFLHHELQAAELMCWAVLRFPTAPLAFRRGLIGIAQDELRHMRMYADHMAQLGTRYGDHPVNDWLLTRGTRCATPAQFVATIGLGFEGANLDHTERFAALFRAAGDPAGARLQEIVGAEEERHVGFAARWFARFSGPLRFDAWSSALPAPLSPMLMRGKPLQRAARARAGMPPDFIDALEAFEPT